MKYLYTGALMCSTLFQIHTAEAYRTTDQYALTTDGRTGVYVVEFEFGHGKHEVSIPRNIVRSDTEQKDLLSYEILTDGERIDGETVGIVLSSLPVENGMYIVPKGQMATFTLLTFFTPAAPGSYGVGVTGLPFYFDQLQKLQLNPSELQYYQTEKLDLKI